MSFRSLKRRISWRLQRISEELPSLPPIPTPAKIARWWRERRRSGLAGPFSGLPSRTDIAHWWQELRNQEFFPRLPSRHDIKTWWQQWRNEDSLVRVPRPPSPKRVAEWFREGPALPSVPSPSGAAEFFQERPSAWKVFIWIFLLALFAAGLIYAAFPARRAIKSWQARRLADQAEELIAQERWSEANRKIHDAFLIRSSEFEVWRVNARLLSAAGQGGAAVEWWEKVAHVSPLSVNDRRDLASASLAANDLDLAETQITAITAAGNTLQPRDRMLLGQLKASRGQNSNALKIAQDVLHDSASRPRDNLAASLLLLSVAGRDSPEYGEAAARVFEVAKDVHNPASLDALTTLGRQLAAVPPTEIYNRPLAIVVPEVPARNISAVDIAERLEAHPNARAYHKMLALELQARAEPNRTEGLIGHAVHTYANADDETLGALCAWLYTRGKFESILELLPVNRASSSRQLLVERIDALASLNRLGEIKEMLSVEYSVLPETFQHMYLAVVCRRLGEKAATANEWQRALETADSADTLLALADFAEKNGQSDIVESALALAVIKQPGLRSAYVRRLRLLELIGPTAKAQSVATEMLQIWPDDLATRMHEIYLRLLLTSSSTEAAAAEQEAETLASKISMSGVARSTIALARLRQGHAAAAMEALSDAPPEPATTNISWPVYTAALAANGWKDKAREQARKIEAVNILPEERALFAPLLEERRDEVRR